MFVRPDMLVGLSHDLAIRRVWPQLHAEHRLHVRPGISHAVRGVFLQSRRGSVSVPDLMADRIAPHAGQL